MTHKRLIFLVLVAILTVLPHSPSAHINQTHFTDGEVQPLTQPKHT
jgi:hypothetical protein